MHWAEIAVAREFAAAAVDKWESNIHSRASQVASRVRSSCATCCNMSVEVTVSVRNVAVRNASSAAALPSETFGLSTYGYHLTLNGNFITLIAVNALNLDADS